MEEEVIPLKEGKREGIGRHVKEAQSLTERNVQPFDITGRPMAGWIMVTEAGWKTDKGLARWMGIGKKFALSLPEKKGKTKTTKTKTLREYRR